jgi:Cu-Zn family superoxide dismutase
VVSAAALAVLLAGCSSSTKESDNLNGTGDAAVDTTTGTIATTAVATVAPTQGNTVAGTVTFTEEPGGVHIVADLSGLAPGTHGFHVHTNGDCSAPDASSAGDHFNPDSMSHGGPDTPMRHLGDLGNLDAASDGRAHYDRVLPGLSLNGPNGLVGKSVVVHATTDDFKTQPSGNSGARLGCGVIETRP